MAAPVARLAGLAAAVAVAWDGQGCSGWAWEADPDRRDFAETGDKEGYRCCGSRRATVCAGRRRGDSLEEAAARCALLLADASGGALRPSRRRRRMTPSANAWEGCILTAGTEDKGGLEEVVPWREAVAGRTLRRAVFPAARPRARLTREQMLRKNWTTRAGRCSRSAACHSWCICHW